MDLADEAGVPVQQQAQPQGQPQGRGAVADGVGDQLADDEFRRVDGVLVEAPAVEAVAWEDAGCPARATVQVRENGS